MGERYAVGPRRKVESTSVINGRMTDTLSCGHSFVWESGDNYGWGGTFEAKYRLCRQCGRIHNASIAQPDPTPNP